MMTHSFRSFFVLFSALLLVVGCASKKVEEDSARTVNDYGQPELLSYILQRTTKYTAEANALKKNRKLFEANRQRLDGELAAALDAYQEKFELKDVGKLLGIINADAAVRGWCCQRYFEREARQDSNFVAAFNQYYRHFNGAILASSGSIKYYTEHKASAVPELGDLLQPLVRRFQQELVKAGAEGDAIACRAVKVNTATQNVAKYNTPGGYAKKLPLAFIEACAESNLGLAAQKGQYLASAQKKKRQSTPEKFLRATRHKAQQSLTVCEAQGVLLVELASGKQRPQVANMLAARADAILSKSKVSTQLSWELTQIQKEQPLLIRGARASVQKTPFSLLLMQQQLCPEVL